MAADISLKDIQTALGVADIKGFTQTFTAVGGGEINDTFLLDFAGDQFIMRVAKYKEQAGLKSEAAALSLLNSPYIPRLIYFNENNRIKGRMWILETRLPGSVPDRLSPAQFSALGELLALVHKVKTNEVGVPLWSQFLEGSAEFGTEQQLLNHPDPALRTHIGRAYSEFQRLQAYYNLVAPTLTHSDATPGNTLVLDRYVGLVDWEFAKFTDPMAEFATIYYEDMDYNQGRWRIKIYPEEKAALFEGYTRGGGTINEERIRFWIWFDKLGAAVFLYWRLHLANRADSQEQTDQFKRDYANLITSLGQPAWKG